MRQALKTNWQIDLPEAKFEELTRKFIKPAAAAPAPAPVEPASVQPAPAEPTPAPVAAQPTATVVPLAVQRRAVQAEHRAEVADIISALSRAVEEIRHADSRATQAEAANRDYSGRLLAAEERARSAESKAIELEEQVKVTEGNLRLIERKFQQVSDWQAQQVAETEAELERLRSAVETAQTRVTELEAGAIEQDAAMKAIIEDAGNRLYAAETRANDATRDFEALREFITTNFVK